MANFFPRWTNVLPLKIAVCLGVRRSGSSGRLSPTTRLPRRNVLVINRRSPSPTIMSSTSGQLGTGLSLLPQFCGAFRTGQHSLLPTPAGIATSTCARTARSWRSTAARLTTRTTLQATTASRSSGCGCTGIPITSFSITPRTSIAGSPASLVTAGWTKWKVVYPGEEPHSMGWCLDCHRASGESPAPVGRGFQSQVRRGEVPRRKTTFRDAKGKPHQARRKISASILKIHWNIQSKESCSTCHR